MSRSLDRRPADPEVAYEIVELPEALMVHPRDLGGDHEVGGGFLHMGDGTIERVDDPLFQAFVATGFFRPR